MKYSFNKHYEGPIIKIYYFIDIYCLGFCLLMPFCIHTLDFNKINNLSHSTEEIFKVWNYLASDLFWLNEKRERFLSWKSFLYSEKKVSFLQHEMLYSPVIMSSYLSHKWNCPNQIVFQIHNQVSKCDSFLCKRRNIQIIWKCFSA